MYFDLMVANERKATVIIRQVSNVSILEGDVPITYAYEVYDYRKAEVGRGTVDVPQHKGSLGVVSAVLADYC